MGLPRAQTHPAEFGATRLILADHVIAAAVLLDGHVALGTLFGVCSDPVGGLRVVVALFYPLFEPLAFDRVVPKLATAKAEDVTARAFHHLCVEVLSFDGVGAVGRRTPSHQTVAFHKAVRD